MKEEKEFTMLRYSPQPTAAGPEPGEQLGLKQTGIRADGNSKASWMKDTRVPKFKKPPILEGDLLIHKVGRYSLRFPHQPTMEQSTRGRVRCPDFRG